MYSIPYGSLLTRHATIHAIQSYYHKCSAPSRIAQQSKWKRRYMGARDTHGPSLCGCVCVYVRLSVFNQEFSRPYTTAYVLRALCSVHHINRALYGQKMYISFRRVATNGSCFSLSFHCHVYDDGHSTLIYMCVVWIVVVSVWYSS